MRIITPQSKSYQALLSINKARHLLLKARQSELRQYHITPREAYITFIMHEIGRKVTLDELVWYTEREKSTISVQMRRMKRDGLVEITREEPRSNLLTFTLTKKGLDLHKKIIQLRLMNKLLSSLSDKEMELLISLLNRVASKAEKYLSD